ncbi:MAG: hypothetical protein IKL16_06105 [Clostridia bacterium]|nr:hypothetical protein [Clostridia bacterium]
MKRIIALLLAVLCFVSVFSGCEKVDRNEKTTETTTLKAELPEIETSYNEKNRTMKTVYRNPDGEITSISVVTYNENKQIVKESTYDKDDNLVNMITYKYDENSNIIEQAVFNSEEKMEYMYKDYEYKKVKTDNGEKFIKIKHNRYDSEGKVDVVFKWEYDEDYNCTAMETYSTEGELLTRNDF